MGFFRSSNKSGSSRASDHEIIERKPRPGGTSPVKTGSSAARRSEFRLGLAVMFAIFAAGQFYGHAAAQTRKNPASSKLDVLTMQAGNAELLLHVTVVEGKSRNLSIPESFEDVAVGSPEIADVVPISNKLLYILGRRVGTTNVLIYGPNKKLIGNVDVEVKLDTSSLGAKIREASGGKDIHVDEVNGKLVLSRIPLFLTGTLTAGPRCSRRARV
jgi:pilus assembly protein CpaC